MIRVSNYWFFLYRFYFKVSLVEGIRCGIVVDNNCVSIKLSGIDVKCYISK